MGFTWAATGPCLVGAGAAPVVSTVVGSTRVSFVGDPTLAGYVRIVGGQPVTAADGALVAKIHGPVQYRPVSADRPTSTSNRSMYTVTLGSGRVVPFRVAHGLREPGRGRAVARRQP